MLHKVRRCNDGIFLDFYFSLLFQPVEKTGKVSVGSVMIILREAIWKGAKHMDYNFYGWNSTPVSPVTDEYAGIKNQTDLYEALSHIWSADTCAPRMRDEWTKENYTLGQCSVTAFLVQDIFGGKVYGILRSGGNYHCYNIVGDSEFDLTSEQFGDEVLDYTDNPEQDRAVHFEKEEKHLRYELLKTRLREYCNQKYEEFI